MPACEGGHYLFFVVAFCCFYHCLTKYKNDASCFESYPLLSFPQYVGEVNLGIVRDVEAGFCL